jgi:hypothetical protein
MKALWFILSRSWLIYTVFASFLMIALVVNVKGGGHFRFRNGEETTDGQQRIYNFVLWIMVVASGLTAFKSTRYYWRLWHKAQKFHSLSRGKRV